MTKKWEDFISDFHNIKGVSVGERQRNFQHFLKANSVPQDEQQLLVANLKPKSYLESLWHIDILIHFKKTAQLLEILRSKNVVFVGKIIKEQWFFHEAFNNVSAEELITVYFPLMSYSVKAKLLKKLTLTFSEEKLDKVFDGILKRYGLNLASRVIPGCSIQKITSILRIYDVNLLTNHLKTLYIKEPNLIRVYFEELKQRQKENVYADCFLKYLAQKDPMLFWEIVETGDFKNNVKLGRRTTKKAANVNKGNIISKPAKYLKYLRQETLVRDLNKQGDFRLFFLNIFPKEVNDLQREETVFNKILKYYPKHNRYDVYVETFNNVLKEDIWSRTYHVTDSFLPLINDVNVREKWAELKSKENNNNYFLRYYSMENCMAIVMKKISVTSKALTRQELFEILISACALNEDYKAFEKILKYYCEGHCNEDKYTTNKILVQIKNNIKLEHLQATHWKYIQQVIRLQEVHNNFYGNYDLLWVKHIEYLLNNSHTEDEITRLIVEYIKTEVERDYLYFSAINKVKNAAIKKKILLQILIHLPKYIDDNNKANRLFYLVEKIMEYNLRNKSDEIDVYINQSVVDILKQSFKSGNAWGSSKMFPALVCKLNRNKLENELLYTYWEEILPRMCSNSVMKWYLRHDPLLIIENFHKIMDSVVQIFVNNNSRWRNRFSTPSAEHLFRQIWIMMKLYSHLNLDDMLKDYALNLLKSDKTNQKNATVWCIALAVLGTTEEYVNIVQDFNLLPTSAKRSMEDGTEVFKLQKMFLAAFKWVTKPLDYLSFLVDNFCQGDYLQISLSALYSSFHKSPEVELKPYIDKLSKNKAVSVRKHALSLSRGISDENTVLEILKCFESESDSSLTKCMFLGILRHFSLNPSQLIFDKVVSYPRLLNHDDMESLEALTTVWISKGFKTRYIENIWPILEQFKLNTKKENVGKIYRFLSAILDLIDKSCLQDLPKSFCKEVIQNYAFNNDVNRISSVLPFVIRFLMYSDSQVENFEFVFELLSKYKSNFWHSKSRKNERGIIFKFFEAFYAKACEKEVKTDFIELFYKYWDRVYTPIDTFKEYLLVNLLLSKKQSDGDLEAYAKDIVLFSEKVNAQFGEIAFSQFITVLSNSLDKKKHQILSNMLKFKTTRLNCILVMRLIMHYDDLFCGNQIIKPYWDVHTTLQTQLTDPSVQLYYNLYFRQ